MEARTVSKWLKWLVLLALLAMLGLALEELQRLVGQPISA